MAVEHFVIVAGIRKTPGYGAEVSVIAAKSPSMAHIFAADHYRKTYKLAANVHIDTKTVYRNESEAAASVFMARLLEAEREKNADPGSSKQQPKVGEG